MVDRFMSARLKLSALRPEHLQVWLSLFRHTLSDQDNAEAAEALFDIARRDG